jgi:hypothetical protein
MQQYHLYSDELAKFMLKVIIMICTYLLITYTPCIFRPLMNILTEYEDVNKGLTALVELYEVNNNAARL